MRSHDDPRLCVSIECAAGRTRLILVDGIIEFNRPMEMNALIKRERLALVPRSELRAMTARFVPAANFEALDREATGRDGLEVELWKEVAYVQEQFRGYGDGWYWWGRFIGCNSSSTCANLLRMLSQLAVGQSGKRRNGMPIDWLDLLRKVMAQMPSTSVDSLRAALERELADDTNER